MERVRVRAVITGRVQGVFFRESTRRVAEELGLSGWVRNLSDGRVEAVFEGSDLATQKALEFVRTGPPHAKVEQVEVRVEVPEGKATSFEVKRRE